MSTRYVWERHEIKENYKLSTTSAKEYTYNVPSGNIACISGNYYKISNSKFMVYSSINPDSIGYGDHMGQQMSMVYKYVLPTPSGTYSSYDEMLSFQNNYAILVEAFESKVKIWSTRANGNYDDRETFYINRATLESKEMGDFISNASDSSGDYYPNNGVDSYGFYWYVYKGSDNIDPYSVSYSDDSPNPGDSITIRASTRTPTYGGTINYQFSYSIDGGSSWTNIGSKSTTPSVSVTIPTNAEQFMGRVVASDTWGFTSTSYIRCKNLSLRDLLAYVGVDGKARSVSKIYVGVDGKAREVKAGYVGVNGKARKFM